MEVQENSEMAYRERVSGKWAAFPPPPPLLPPAASDFFWEYFPSPGEETNLSGMD